MSIVPVLLRRRRFYSVSPLAIYAVLGFKPELVLDFDDEKYFADSTATTFSDALTHSASSNATMVDSDGVLKWRPHNLLKYSEQFDNAVWTKTNTTITANAIAAPRGSVVADAIVEAAATGEHNVFQSITGGLRQTVGVFVKAGLRQNFILRQNLSSVWRNANFVLSGSGSVGTTTGFDAATITALGDGWYYCTATSTNRTDSKVLFLTSTGDEVISFAGDDSAPALYLWGAHLYRSDLGGMVNNPDTGNSYVPTTSAARYLPRRGHHVWNGTAWANEGLLVESEARTNLVQYSIPNATNWSVFGSPTIAVNNATAPDGTTSATRLTATVATKSVTFIYESAGTHRSFFAKAGTANFIHIDYPSFLSGIWFDLGNGVVATDASGVATIEDYGNGWYRCSCPTNGANFSVGFSDSDNSDAVTIGAYGWVWGAQSENTGHTPSSYIPTSGTTVTRAAETLTIPAAKLPYSATAMSIQMDGRITFADNENSNEAVAFNWAESSNNYNNIVLSTTDANVGTSNVGEFRYPFRSSAGSIESLFSGVELPIGTFKGFSVATRALGNGTTGGVINIAQSGTAAIEEAFAATGGVLPDLSTTDPNLGFKYMGTIRTFRMWNQDITDAGIEVATV